MRRAAVVALLVACKSEPEPAPPAKSLLSVAAEVRGRASLVAGTRRIALRAGVRWFDFVDGKPVENAALAASIAQQFDAMGGEADIFLGTTPILVGGEHHHEVHVRPGGVRVELDGLASEVVTTSDREVWRFEHELVSHVAFVRGTDVVVPPHAERIGPEPQSASPVSRRKCKHPLFVDLDATATTAYALVVECSDAAPIRVLAYDGDRAREIRMQSADELKLKPAAIAVRDSRIAVVGIREPETLAVASPDNTVATNVTGVSRVLVAVIADDNALWVLATTRDGTIVVRDGKPVVLDGKRPTHLALDAHLGVVVLATGINAQYLLAERPTTSLVITPPR